jgi:hypothetical protein
MSNAFSFTDTDVPIDAHRDEAPPSSFEYACEVCGKELLYGGRGRKPKFCDEHKKGGAGKSVSRRGGGNLQLATQAADALVQLNSLCAMGLMLAHLPQTASTLAGTEEGFREQAISALLTDPALCKSILKAGTTSGKVSLLIAYAMLAGAVVPVGVVEFKERQETIKAAEDASWSEVA